MIDPTAPMQPLNFEVRDAAAALSDADLEPASREYLERVGVVQGLGVPWVENGEVTSVIGVQWHKERVISAFDISAIERVLETTMGWIERERGRERGGH